MVTSVVPPPRPKRKRSAVQTVLIIVGICAAAFVFLGFFIFRSLSNSEAARLGMEQLQASPEAVRLLGEPIQRGWLVQGSINVSNSSGHAELAIPVKGAVGKGKLYVVAEKKMGLWTLEDVQVEVEGQPQRIVLVHNESPQ